MCIFESTLLVANKGFTYLLTYLLTYKLAYLLTIIRLARAFQSLSLVYDTFVIFVEEKNVIQNKSTHALFLLNTI